MADRVADIWGTRTPHAKDAPWPVRVDLHLDTGVAESDVDQWMPSACVLCSNGCGCDIAVKDGRVVGVRGRADDVVNHGRMGASCGGGTATARTPKAPPSRRGTGGAAPTSTSRSAAPTTTTSNQPTSNPFQDRLFG
jgi:molybdopterin-dependent oxidoreductase iron-sulfur protein